LYLNERNNVTEAAIARYTQPPFNIKVMGDENNYGITWPMIWLIGNASNEHVLFLEKDFQLVESNECAMQQLDIGVKMLEVRGTVSATHEGRLNEAPWVAVAAIPQCHGDRH
jgi:hypothetical protein